MECINPRIFRINRQTYVLIERQISEEFNKTQKFNVSLGISELPVIRTFEMH